MGPFNWPVSKVLHTITGLKNWFGCGVGLTLSFLRSTNVSTFQIHNRIQTTEHLTLTFWQTAALFRRLRKKPCSIFQLTKQSFR
ncbi:hypothetical protein TorRG33x02_033410 [Trema orientale]|uniref:Uncharacterized protein n=1 Tax=Trema orientale TaxID=63057 RepID=A0A2P5FSF7_TREOI|nr:hypothetical protein TorRG33x02_033410 [Trema orientale]